MKKILLRNVLIIILVFTSIMIFTAPINAQGDEPDISNLCTHTIITENYETTWTWSTPCGSEIIAAYIHELNPQGIGISFCYHDNILPGNITHYWGFGTSTFTVLETDIFPADRNIIQIDILYDCCPKKSSAESEPEIWQRDHEFQCWQVWVNESNQFEFVFVWEYYNNNHVQILDQAGNVVFYIDLPKGDCQFVADLPDGTYTVQNYHEYGHILREFVISKP